MKSLSSLLTALLVDTRRLLPEVKGLERDKITLEARFKNEGIGFLSVALPSLGKAFDQGLDCGRFTCPPGFRQGGAIPRLFSGMLCEVFDPITGDCRSSASPEYIRCIRELLYFFKKFTPSADRNELLDRNARREFTQCDLEIVGLADFRRDHIARLSNLVLGNLDDYQDLNCKHGPGAVAEGYLPNQKWLGFYQRLSDWDEKLIGIGYDTVASLHCDMPSNEVSSSDTLPSLVAKLVTVPKSCVSLRTITVEPMLNQFVQQGYNDWLRKAIDRCPVMSRSLSLNSQEPNQKLALKGSISGDWVTVDLSSASDRLSTVLVEAAFAHRPRFLQGILGCRTPFVDVGDKPIALKKYAGMGNATTFPVQSYVFALVALASMVPLHKRVSGRQLRALARNVRVFGDDIIIKREHYSAFADWITSCGLKINRSKTFSGRSFRESCGVDAYKGVDVTPLYLRHDPDFTSSDPSALVGLMSTVNQLWLACRYSTSNALLKIIQKGLLPFPLVPKKSGCLGLHTRQDVRTYQRWSPTLHRFEVRTYVTLPMKRKDPLCDMAALMKFFHESREISRDFLPAYDIREKDPSHLRESVRRFNLKLRKRWVPSL